MGVLRRHPLSQRARTMNSVADRNTPVSPQLVAGLLLAARDHLRRLDLPRPGVEQILEATGASRTRAYELRDAVLEALPSLQRPVGRPAAPPGSANSEVSAVLSLAVVGFLMDHPGCVHGSAERRRYGDAFRHFVVEMRGRHAGEGLEAFAAAVLVPVGTLKDWIGAGPSCEPANEAAPDAATDRDEDDPSASPSSTQIETVLVAWKTWSGSFVGFCEHVQEQWRIPFGRTIIADILATHGERQPRRRTGRSPDEEALRRSFETFFPGAQWVGDGSPIAVVMGVTICERRFLFNLELMVDASSGGFVGMSVRYEEDSAAVVEAFGDGVKTTGAAPLGVLLDNRPSNHTTEVDEALGDTTLRMRATKGRPQNKAHCEGGFGLFQQTVPPLEINAGSLRDHARQMLVLVAQTWARTLNHLPRRDRGGRSRVDLYGEKPSAEQIAQARAAIEERCRKQDLARETLKARQDPVVRALLDEAFARLALEDPQNHLRVAIARYPMGCVVDGIAIFEAKRAANTLPDGVDARYLLGIVRNLGNEREGVAIAEALLRARLEARDRLLAPLVLARDAARSATRDGRTIVLRFVDLALAAERQLDRLFWLLAVSEVIRDANGTAALLVEAAARRIHGTHRVTYRERLRAVRFVIQKVAPLD